MKGGSVLAEFRPFFNVAVPQLFFFFKRKHVHTDLKKFRLKETVFEKTGALQLNPICFSWQTSAVCLAGADVGDIKLMEHRTLDPFFEGCV